MVRNGPLVPGRRLVALLAIGMLLTPSAAAAAGAPTTNPLSGGASPLSPTPTTPTPTPTVTATNSPGSTAGSSSLSGGSVVGIAVGALVVLGGISLFIWRDARRRAPVRQRATDGGAGAAGGRSGSRARVKPRKLSPAERRRRKRGRARR